MKLHSIAVLWAASLPVLAPAAEAADPAVAVPPPAYRSVFEGLPTGVEEGTVAWRKANADVGEFPRGHADILKWEQNQGAVAPGVQAPPAAGPNSAPAAAPRGHQH